MTKSKLTEKKDICPLSGIGKPPSEWSACVVQCGWYDASTGVCAVNALMHLRELPGLHSSAGDVATALLVM
jgi:hypothetical protein